MKQNELNLRNQIIAEGIGMENISHTPSYSIYQTIPEIKAIEKTEWVSCYGVLSLKFHNDRDWLNIAYDKALRSLRKGPACMHEDLWISNWFSYAVDVNMRTLFYSLSNFFYIRSITKNRVCWFTPDAAKNAFLSMLRDKFPQDASDVPPTYFTTAMERVWRRKYDKDLENSLFPWQKSQHQFPSLFRSLPRCMGKSEEAHEAWKRLNFLQNYGSKPSTISFDEYLGKDPIPNLLDREFLINFWDSKPFIPANKINSTMSPTEEIKALKENLASAVETFEKLKSHTEDRIKELESKSWEDEIAKENYHLVAGGYQRVQANSSPYHGNLPRKYTFKTQANANLIAEKTKLMMEMHRFAELRNGGWVPNWDNDNKGFEKFGLLVQNNLVFTGCFSVSRSSPFGIFFKTRTIAEEAIKTFGPRILELYSKQF